MDSDRRLSMLYRESITPLDYYFDTLTAPPLLYLLSNQDIFELNRIARSIKLSGKIDEKYRLIDNVMIRRGFTKLHAGTNRVVYRFNEDQRFVVKVAVDRVGLKDNPAEFKNQFLLKPFVTKVFEVSPCGTVGLFERVNPIMSREEFLSVADDVFDLITKIFVGKYILEDFGSWYFMNYGWRNNRMGIVLLDFPYVYEVDGNKLYCTAKNPYNRDIICGGEIDYDAGFNNLICSKCGKVYNARDLQKTGKDKVIIVGGKKRMKVKVSIGNKVIVDSSKNQMSKVIEKPDNKPIVKESKPVKKEKPVVKDKVENRTKAKQQPVKEKPTESILRKEEKQEKTMNEDMEDLLDTYQEDDYEEDEYEEYNQYLSNRERSNKSKPKKSRKKGGDFSDF